MFSQVNWPQMIEAVQQTLFMTFVSLLISSILGLVFGIILYVTQKDGLYENKVIYFILNLTINVLRAIPFIILMILILPCTKALVGSMLGVKAALPSLVLSSAPLYARMCMISLTKAQSKHVKQWVQAIKKLSSRFSYLNLNRL